MVHRWEKPSAGWYRLCSMARTMVVGYPHAVFHEKPPALMDYGFQLPPERIARYPATARENARLMVLGTDSVYDHRVSQLKEILSPPDLLVVNDSRVMQARCFMRRRSGGLVEVLLLQPGPGSVKAMLKPARRLRVGETLEGEGGTAVTMEQRLADGIWLVRTVPAPAELMKLVGQVPLPPYIRRPVEPQDRHRYQTVYSRTPGSVAAPTAGLHLTEELLTSLRRKGVGFCSVTLHVGPGTFRPLRSQDLSRGLLHEELYDVPAETVRAIRRTRQRGGRIVVVGTTTLRALESATPQDNDVPLPGPGRTRLFIREGYSFRIPDALMTNFHLPNSSLLMLVAAFAGRGRIIKAYRHALERGYRFYSYGDAMLIL